MFGSNIREDRRADDITRPFDLSLDHQPSFLLADFDILPNLVARPLVDQRTHARTRILRVSDRQALHGVGQATQEYIIDGFMDDGPRTGRAFLSLIAGE